MSDPLVFTLPIEMTLPVSAIGLVDDNAPPDPVVAHVMQVIRPAVLTATGAVAVTAPPLELVTHVAHEIAPAALTPTGTVPVKAPPLVVVAHVGQAMVPVVVMVPPVTGDVVATLVTVPLPVPRDNVTPPIRAWTAADVTHKSPLAGEVGAVPGGRLKPAAPTADAVVMSFPEPVRFT